MTDQTKPTAHARTLVEGHDCIDAENSPTGKPCDACRAEGRPQVEGLATCPFCGAALFRSISYSKYFEIRHEDGCFLAGSPNSFPRLIHPNAIPKWNTRANSTATKVEKLEAALRNLISVIVDPSDVVRVFSKWVDEYPEFREPQLIKLREAILAADAALVESPDTKEEK